MKNKVIPIFYCWILSLFILGCNASANETIDKDRSTHTWMIDTQAQWLQYREKSTHLEIKDGFASMNTIECSYKSTLMQFEHKRSAESIVFKQSDLWQNWQPIDNIGPENLRDAPVILSLGDGNVWLFGMYGGKGRKNKEKIEPDFKAEKIQIQGYEMPLWTTPFANQYDAAGGLKEKKGGYHAWHSKDMKTWIHHGAVPIRLMGLTAHLYVIKMAVFMLFMKTGVQSMHANVHGILHLPVMLSVMMGSKISK
jgi:hypothetical protein